MVIRGTTATGFEFAVDTAVFDDWEILEKLNVIDSGDASATVDVARAVLGEDQLKALKEHVRNEDGKVTITAMMEVLEDIFNASNEQTKN